MTSRTLLHFLLFLPTFLLHACASASGSFVPLDATHPASSEAPEIPVLDPSASLRAGSGGAPAALPPESGAEAGNPPAEGALVCPMHPEVSSDVPGRCPKCGMALVPRAETEKQEEHPHGK
jgi:hypothetical protein